MPAPPTPNLLAAVAALQASVDAQTVEIQAQTAAIAALAEDIERVANYQRFLNESIGGPSPSTSGIWDGTDRYT